MEVFMKKAILILFIFLFILFINYSYDYTGKKVLYIDSYHEGYEWSDGITNGIKNVLQNTKIELKIFRMDTKRNNSEEFKKNAGLKAKNLIDQFKPDVVICSDDNAAKYLIVPYFYNSNIPFVFCGLNFDASIYGFPAKNITGMVEMELIQPIIDHLKEFAKGNRIGLLSSDNETSRKVGFYTKKLYVSDLVEYYAKTFSEWKKYFLELQNKVDILILDNNSGINDWNNQEAEIFVISNTKIPTGANNSWMTPYTVLGYTKVEEEFGEYAAKTALEILNGKSPKDIPVVINKRGKLFINLKLANKLGYTFKQSILKMAKIIK